jgi:integrase/recombinase XerD
MELCSGHKEVLVTHLLELTIEKMTRRNFTESTTRAYVRIIEDLALYFNRPPDQLGPEHIREYTAHLFRDRKLSDNTVNQTVGALRFFFLRTLRRPWSGDEMPYPKKKIHLPVIWSPEEVACLIDAALIPFYHILMTLYGTGVRRAECAAFKLTDSDAARMVVHVHDGNRWHTADYPISDKVVWLACRESAKRAGVNKPLDPHTLRHCFATHLLEGGADLRTIQLLLGHADLRETMIYLHLSKRHVGATVSLIDETRRSTRAKELGLSEKREALICSSLRIRIAASLSMPLAVPKNPHPRNPITPIPSRAWTV